MIHPWSVDAVPVPTSVEPEPLDVLPAPPSRLFELAHSSADSASLLASLAERYGVSPEEETRRQASIERSAAEYDARQAAMAPGEREAALAELRTELLDNALVDQI